MAGEAAQPPVGGAPNWTIPQDWQRYSLSEHTMWNQLFAR